MHFAYRTYTYLFLNNSVIFSACNIEHLRVILRVYNRLFYEPLMKAGLSSESAGAKGEKRGRNQLVSLGRKVISVRSTSLETRTLIKPSVLDTFPEMPQISSPFPTPSSSFSYSCAWKESIARFHFIIFIRSKFYPEEFFKSP